ncbi:hypothetical protein CGRA01v4_04074 [Colletotrichum graminicola]|uniref:DUF1295 domain-containing protein n=1 Tax=Colletotrichum graminicola (strain M1.001 / M2 / FGSC 10212) TaxID=645133 RepID=E3QXM6_COLGM|nr:uncharacterized protein GLRG_10758 [Colletotrichum graminicola M1.001]EFQ35614.1 hypothetical protein GLRG_10758 [Colletotrichum graminicola M1.001]WDK12793.1 hypothetical protein CGRA01v4_04074 [Colletotrichum graminicola]
MADRGEGYNARLGVNTNEIPTAQHLPNATSGAEQDRYGGWFGGRAAEKAGEEMDRVAEKVKENMPRGSGAEQDRYGGWFGGKGDEATEKLRQNMPRGSGAEQDRYERWFGGDKGPSGAWVRDHLPDASGAEQDRYGAHWDGAVDKFTDKIKEKFPGGAAAKEERVAGWFGDKADKAGHKLDEAGDKIRDNLPRVPSQERVAGWFGDKADKAGHKLDEAGDKIRDNLPRVPSQERVAGWFGDKADKAGRKIDHAADSMPRASGAEQDRYASHFEDKAPSADRIYSRLPRASVAEQDRYASHFSLHPSNPINTATTTTLGLVQNVLLPSFGLHAGLSTVTYAVARYTNRAEAKDWLWPSGQVANAWWSAIGTRVLYDGLSFSSAWSSLGYTQKLLLTGVSAWGLRLFYRIVTRSAKRGKDDARYVEAKKDPQFWDKAFFTMFLPEAALQALISLPFTLPFRAPLTSAAASPFTHYPETFHSLAVFLFTTGFALETLADTQLEDHSRKSQQLNREGVWSIVRHPNYLGDALCHLSFPVLLYSAGMMHPLAALGPVFNYVILRYLGGDKQTEASQEVRYTKENPLKLQQLREYKRDKNSFWPSVAEYDNKWVWTVAAVGVAGAVVERGLLAFFQG